MVIYDREGRGGDYRYIGSGIPYGYPDLRWINFNDLTSSLWMSGYRTLYEHIQYRGRRLYTIGLPWLVIERLSEVNFDNTASSIW